MDDWTLSAPPPLDHAADALFLDFDGTLVDIAPRPDAVEVPPGLHTLLAGLVVALRGCVAVVSGRSLATLDGYLQSGVPILAGIHGAQARGIATPFPQARAEAALARVRTRLAQDSAGLLIEDKGLAIALHFRHAPELQAPAGALAAALADGSGGVLSVQPGHMVFELKPAGVDKGDVVRRCLADPRFMGRRPVFVGDDLTDEAGFGAAASAGGYGVLVGARRPTAALHHLADVRAVHTWLEQPVEAAA